MFNNLIESTSHAKEFKRRGSFVLFTTATYLVLFVVTGVISIYAYDAHLETQSTELEITMMPVLAREEPEPAPPRNTIPNTHPDTSAVRSTRVGELIDSASNPNNVPPVIGTVAPSVPPARSDSVLGNENVDPISPPTGGRGVPGGSGNGPGVDVPDTPPPPPAPQPKPAVPPVLRVSVVLNSRALELPKPTYPRMAVQIHLQGTVTVQVLIDETGRVVSAKALGGHPLLVPEAQKAALQARFSPTKISDQPVKVSGVITYNFILP